MKTFALRALEMSSREVGSPNGISHTDEFRKVIYDLGANNGDDVAYYLKKADLVVAVEANPALCEIIGSRFSTAIEDGKLRVENCILVAEGGSQEATFYLHKRHHVLGQFPRPHESVIGDYNQVLLPTRTVMQIVREYGSPYYIKVDIEGYDHVILDELFKNQIRPPFISAESSSIQVFALLAAMGQYRAFKLVEGATVAKRYKTHTILVNGRREVHSFTPHSAGPFGNDIPGAWMNADDLFALLATRKMGWRDIHATNLFHPDSTSRDQRRRYMYRHFRGWLLARLRSLKKRIFVDPSSSTEVVRPPG